MASLSARRVEPSDEQHIQSVIMKALERAKKRCSKIWLHTIDIDCVMEMIRSRDTSYVVEGYLVVYDVVVPFYSRLPVLAEVMVLRIGRGGTISDVAAFLQAKAQEAGCPTQHAGTAFSFNDDTLANLYIKEGFSQGGVSLCKVT